ncbi:SRPBCC domain-containing protein [Altererythrobacter salegens]|uniref:SRPBCC domain-containing protein n=1 Tax=Croceibacterium salegens TaxID=1737568 RepID=A0A6I4SWG6_9SPHN|nr:SRPBCC domain-containing protein [Croceibacterium salegens]MXO59136.1 SRPBCC domain-containing protein [Croceibacterium salegens]
MTAPDVPVFVISRTFDAPIERVYDAWADPQKMVQWSGPKGSTYEIVQGEVAEGKSSIARNTSDTMDLHALCLWREFTPPTRVVWEQSICDADGNKVTPPFFEHWPATLLTEVDLAEKDGKTEVTLHWTPIEYTDEALAIFAKQMAGMAGGWGGSFDKLDEYLAETA